MKINNCDLKTRYENLLYIFLVPATVLSHSTCGIFRRWWGLLYLLASNMRPSKICKKCAKLLPLSGYYTHREMGDGHLNFCKTCVKRRVVLHRKRDLESVRAYDRGRDAFPNRVAKRKEYTKTKAGKLTKARSSVKYREKYPEKYKARTMFGNAVRAGKVVRAETCVWCGLEGKTEGHHEDYSKPLDVAWLCPPCHRSEHKASHFR